MKMHPKSELRAKMFPKLSKLVSEHACLTEGSFQCPTKLSYSELCHQTIPVSQL